MSIFKKLIDFKNEVEKRELQNNIKNLQKNYDKKHSPKKSLKDEFLEFIYDTKSYFKKIKSDKIELYFFVKEIIATVVFVVVAVILIRSFIGELRYIPSASMRNTLLEHDRVYVQKMTFWNRELQRGDIIVFYPPQEELSKTPWAIFTRLLGVFCHDIAYIKRIIALPGDKFEIKQENDGKSFVYINDKKLDEPYVISHFGWPECQGKIICGPIVIPKDNYFMMGDNRGNSLDSRFWGTLHKDRVIGRASFLFYPLRRIKKL